MRIGLRVFYNEAWLGGVNYVLNIARMLRALPAGERPFVCFLTSTLAAEEIAARHRGLADLIAPVEQASTLDLDLVYPATQLAEAVFGAPWAGWVPDWQCRHYPDLFAEDERMRRFLQYRALATEPAMCVFSSQQALEDTKAQFGETAETRWRIFHFPAVFPEEAWARDEARIAATVRKFGAPERYFIICNQFWRHKNHLAVVEALARAPELELHVVMTGALEDTRWPEYAKSVKDILQRPDVARRVTITGRIERDEQIDLMLGAAAFIQPSLFEGWSTFVEEARALAMPGLLSDIPVHREQSPEGAVFFDPNDVEDLLLKLKAFNADVPQSPDRAEAHIRHQAYVASCARTFIDIAQEARAFYDPQKHEAASVIARAARCVADEQGAESGPAKGDCDRFFAGLRHLLRTHPEDLARLAGLLCASGAPRAKEFETLIVKATLAKMPHDLRARFDAFEPSELDSDVAEATAAVQASVGSPMTRSRTVLTGVAQRALNYARRKTGL